MQPTDSARARGRRAAALCHGVAAWSPVRWLLILGIPFGILFACVTPPLQAPDEIRHLGRAFLISEGRLGAEMREGHPRVLVPRSIPSMPARLGEGLGMHPERRQNPRWLEREFDLPARLNLRVWVSMPTLYSPLVYLPQALAIRMARGLDTPVVTYVYVGRLANLAAYLTLLALALHLVPAHRFALLAVALLPTPLFLAGSLSGDAVTTGLAFATVGAIWREARAESGPMRIGSVAGLGALAAALSLAKPGYALAVALVLAIPGARFSSRARRAAAVSSWLACGLVPGALWALYIVSLGTEPTVTAGGGGDQPRWVAQLQWIAVDPIAFLGVIVASVRELGWLWMTSLIGLLGHGDTWLPGWLHRLAAATVLAVALLDGGEKSPVRGFARAWALGLGAGGVLVTLCIGYLGWNQVGNPLVLGVQGRYFLPLAPILIPALHWPRGRSLPRAARLTLVLLLALFLVVAVHAVVMRYWS